MTNSSVCGKVFCKLSIHFAILLYWIGHIINISYFRFYISCSISTHIKYKIQAVFAVSAFILENFMFAVITIYFIALNSQPITYFVIKSVIISL